MSPAVLPLATNTDSSSPRVRMLANRLERAPPSLIEDYDPFARKFSSYLLPSGIYCFGNGTTFGQPSIWRFDRASTPLIPWHPMAAPPPVDQQPHTDNWADLDFSAIAARGNAIWLANYDKMKDEERSSEVASETGCFVFPSLAEAFTESCYHSDDDSSSTSSNTSCDTQRTLRAVELTPDENTVATPATNADNNARDGPCDDGRSGRRSGPSCTGTRQREYKADHGARRARTERRLKVSSHLYPHRPSPDLTLTTSRHGRLGTAAEPGAS